MLYVTLCTISKNGMIVVTPICCQNYFHWAVGVIVLELTFMSHLELTNTHKYLYSVTATQACATGQLFCPGNR